MQQTNEKYLKAVELLAYWGVQLYRAIGKEPNQEFSRETLEALNSIGYFGQSFAALVEIEQYRPELITRYIEKKLAGQLDYDIF